MLETIIGALGTTLDGLSALILAVSMGFAAFPTALAYMVAIAGMLIFGQIMPLSSPTEVIVLVAKLGKDKDERQSIIVYSGLLIMALGVTGFISIVVQFVGKDILSAMMAGVAIMLTQVAFGMIKEKPVPGLFSLALALGVYLFTKNLVYTVGISVFGTALFWLVIHLGKENKDTKVDLSQERFRMTRLKMNPSVIRSVLAVFTLMLGGAISNTEITGALSGTTPNMNAVISYMGLGNVVSGFFGGVSVGPIITGTALTPKPQLSAVLFMIFLSVLVLFQIVPRIVKLIPSQGIAGFLMVLSIFVIFPDNAATSMAAAPLVSAITMLVTAAVDPFFGMCAGVAARFLLGYFGMQ